MFCIRLYLCLVLVIPGLTYAKSTVVILGDSLSAGYGLKKNEVWVDLLSHRIASEKLPYTIVNASISGDTTSGGRQRLPSLIEKFSPSILVLELGGNDGLRGLSLDVIENNLNAIIQKCQTHGINVLLIGIRLPPNYGPLYTERFAQIFVTLAEKNNIPLVPSLLAGLEADLELFQADGIHPTSKAQPILLENVWQSLAPLLNTQNVTLSRK